MKEESDDRALEDGLPFVRGGPPAALWPRIEARARSARRARELRTWSLRLAGIAAGAAAWIGVEALVCVIRAPAQPAESIARDERAWLWEAADELPPEARLVTQLLPPEERGR